MEFYLFLLLSTLHLLIIGWMSIVVFMKSMMCLRFCLRDISPRLSLESADNFKPDNFSANKKRDIENQIKATLSRSDAAIYRWAFARFGRRRCPLADLWRWHASRPARYWSTRWAFWWVALAFSFRSSQAPIALRSPLFVKKFQK